MIGMFFYCLRLLLRVHRSTERKHGSIGHESLFWLLPKVVVLIHCSIWILKQWERVDSHNVRLYRSVDLTLFCRCIDMIEALLEKQSNNFQIESIKKSHENYFITSMLAEAHWVISACFSVVGKEESTEESRATGVYQCVESRWVRVRWASLIFYCRIGGGREERCLAAWLTFGCV